MTWSDTFLAALKDNDVRLISYVPDNVLTPLIKGATADNYFMSVNATREDEALGTVAGAWMGGMRGIVMMQTSGFALIANALAWAARDAESAGATGSAAGSGGTVREARESDTTPVPTLTLGGQTLAPPDPPARHRHARFGIWALILAAALLLFDWLGYHRRWTT